MANTGKDKKLATFNIEAETWQAFQAKARENGYSAAALLKEWIGAYLDDTSGLPIPKPATEQTYLDDSQLQQIVEALAPRIIDELAPQVTAAVESRLPDSIDIYLEKNLGRFGEPRLGEPDRLGETETLRQELEAARADIYELNRLWGKSREEIAELRSQLSQQSAAADAGDREILLAGIIEQAKAPLTQALELDARACPPQSRDAIRQALGMLAQQSSPPEEIFLEWSERVNRSRDWALAERDAAKLEAQNLRGELNRRHPAPDYTAIADRTLTSLKLGKQAPGYKAAARAIAKFVELLRE